MVMSFLSVFFAQILLSSHLYNSSDILAIFRQLLMDGIRQNRMKQNYHIIVGIFYDEME